MDAAYFLSYVLSVVSSIRIKKVSRDVSTMSKALRGTYYPLKHMYLQPQVQALQAQIHCQTFDSTPRRQS